MPCRRAGGPAASPDRRMRALLRVRRGRPSRSATAVLDAASMLSFTLRMSILFRICRPVVSALALVEPADGLVGPARRLVAAAYDSAGAGSGCRAASLDCRIT